MAFGIVSFVITFALDARHIDRHCCRDDREPTFTSYWASEFSIDFSTTRGLGSLDRYNEKMNRCW